MRVITGIARGRKLIAPEGMDTRPTSDQSKESIFNIIQFDIEGRAVLDLFAGTGQMGIEALSRGAKSAVFVDNSRTCVDVIARNLKNCELSSMGKIEQTDVRNYINKANPESFGLIFLDPPYNMGLIKTTVSAIMRKDLLAVGGLIVVESDKNEPLPAIIAPYEHLKDYIYGRSRISIIVKKQVQTNENSDISGQL